MESTPAPAGSLGDETRSAEPAEPALLLGTNAIDGSEGAVPLPVPVPPRKPQSTALKQRKKKRGMGPTRRLKRLMRTLNEPIVRPARYLREDYPTDSFLIAANSVDFMRNAEQLEDDLDKGKIERYPRNQRKAGKPRSAASTVTVTETGYPTSYEDSDSFVTYSLASAGQHPFYQKLRGDPGDFASLPPGSLASNQETKPHGMVSISEPESQPLSQEERERHERLQLLNTPDAMGNAPAPPRESMRVSENPSKAILPPPQTFKTRMERDVLAKFDRVAQDVARAELEARHAREEAESKARVLAAQKKKEAEEAAKRAEEAANGRSKLALFKKAGRKMSIMASLSPPKSEEAKKALKAEHKKRLTASAAAIDSAKLLEEEARRREAFKKKREEAAQQRAMNLQSMSEQKRNPFIPKNRTDARRLAKQWLKPIFAAIATARLRLLREKITPVVVAQFKYNFCLRRAEESVRSAARRRQGHRDQESKFRVVVWLTLKLRKWRRRIATQKRDEAADQLLKFLSDCEACRSDFTRMMMDYRKRIVRCQRMARSFLLVRRTRTRVLSMMWQSMEKELIKEHNEGVKNGTLPSYLSTRTPMPREERERRVRRLLQMATVQHIGDRDMYYSSLAAQESLYERAKIDDVHALMEADDPTQLPVLVVDERYQRPPSFFVYVFLAKEIEAALEIFWAKKDEMAKVMQPAHDRVLLDKATDVLVHYKKEKIQFSKLRVEVQKVIDMGTFGRQDLSLLARSNEEEEAEEGKEQQKHQRRQHRRTGTGSSNRSSRGSSRSQKRPASGRRDKPATPAAAAAAGGGGGVVEVVAAGAGGK